jgi:metal-sulfur cluster biosynthetic enzyme
VPGVQEVHLEVVWEPAWSPERIEPQGRKLLRI